MRNKGFTFVELIVVLAILAGLAALVAPSFSRTVASARLRTAASDVRSTFARARATLAPPWTFSRAASIPSRIAVFPLTSRAMTKACRIGTPPDNSDERDRITRDVSIAVTVSPTKGHVIFPRSQSRRASGRDNAARANAKRAPPAARM